MSRYPDVVPPPSEAGTLVRSIRRWLAVFIVGLVLSGITAFPLRGETTFLFHLSETLHLAAHAPALYTWIHRVQSALATTGDRYPFLAYGTDWLAFAHLVIAVAFLGPWQDPVRNRWVITFGLIACLGVLPLAFIAGPLRGIPVFWRLIDSSFGVLGTIPLWIIRKKTERLEGLSRP